MLNVDPLVRIHTPKGRGDLQSTADYFNNHVIYEAFDMLCGRLRPELGGSRRHLGIGGLNYYSTNQWTLAAPGEPQRFLDWRDSDWVPLSTTLGDVQQRYGGPLIIAETGAANIARAPWLLHLAGDCVEAMSQGIDLQGICLYPVLSTPDWEDSTAIFEGGLFDLSIEAGGKLKRVVSRPYAAALRTAQAMLDPAHASGIEGDHEQEEQEEQVADYSGVAAPTQIAPINGSTFTYETCLVGQSLSVEVYCLPPGGFLTAHRHSETEHVWTVLQGQACAVIGKRELSLGPGETALVAAGVYHGLRNHHEDTLIVQQVSSPKPWDARFGGPQPLIANPRELHRNEAAQP